MRKKALHFNDQDEFNIIQTQIAKRLQGHCESISARFDPNQRIGVINLSVWNDMDNNFGFQESLSMRQADDLILLTDNGDAYSIVSDIYRDQHGHDVDPIIVKRIYSKSIAQYQQSSGTHPYLNDDEAIPEIVFPFQKLTEVAGALEQMNTVYFLLARNTSQA